MKSILCIFQLLINENITCLYNVKSNSVECKCKKHHKQKVKIVILRIMVFMCGIKNI